MLLIAWVLGFSFLRTGRCVCRPVFLWEGRSGKGRFWKGWFFRAVGVGGCSGVWFRGMSWVISPSHFLSFEKRKNFRLFDGRDHGALLLVCRILVEFLAGFCVIFSLICGIVDISYKIFCLYGHSWSFVFWSVFHFCYCDIHERPLYGVFMFCLCGIMHIYQ